MTGVEELPCLKCGGIVTLSVGCTIGTVVGRVSEVVMATLTGGILFTGASFMVDSGLDVSSFCNGICNG